MDNQIKCPACNHKFPLDEVIKQQIDAGVRANISEIQTQQMQATLKEAETKAKKQYEIQMQEKDKDIATLRESIKKIQDDYISVTEEKRSSDRESASMRKKLGAEFEEKLSTAKMGLREEIFEESRLKNLEKDKQLEDALKQVTKLKEQAAKTTASLDQNTGQMQGEVLELDIESKLRQNFPYDEIAEVKKFHRGADITQNVKNAVGQTCGLILWETKNAQWKKDWIAKFQQDISEAKARLGVLVSSQMPPDMGELHQWESTNVWIVKPKLAIPLATALRSTLLEVSKAAQNSKIKDHQMKQLYDYIISEEFKYKLENMATTYAKWQEDIDKEKKWFNKKWGRQEKMINSLLTTTVSIHGDFQGVTNDALPDLKDTNLILPQEIEDADFSKDELDVL